jgi:hypothetical protein
MWRDSTISTNVTNWLREKFPSHRNTSGISVHAYLQVLDRVLALTASWTVKWERIFPFISRGRLLSLSELAANVASALASLRVLISSESRLNCPGISRRGEA